MAKNTNEHRENGKNNDRNKEEHQRRNWGIPGQQVPSIHPEYLNTRGEEWLYPPRPTSEEMRLSAELTRRMRQCGIMESGQQVRVDRCWIDIAIFYRGYKVAVECHSDHKKLDERRRTFLRNQDWIVLDCWNWEIDESAGDLADRLIDEIFKIVGYDEAI